MKQDFLIQALGNIQKLPQYPLASWDQLIRQARNADLLGRLAVLAKEADVLSAIPAQPRAHLTSALVLVEAQSNAVMREIAYVHQALQGAGIELTILKGAAYLLAGLPASKGRLFSDMDILVPREQLANVEATLMLSGWANTHHDPYDQRYYREWMHELPPMMHIKRMTVIDVHHAIVPITADLKPSAEKLLTAAQPVPGWPGIKILAPVDMVLHSATHLFYNEEFSHGLRDMSDLDLLLRHFSQQPEFWNGLVDRAEELGLQRPLYYCLHYCIQLFATPIPDATMAQVKTAAPTGYIARLMDDLWLSVLNSLHPTAEATGLYTDLAQQALYIRAHWHKMPLGLLVYHIIMKSLRPKAKTAEQT
jgi:hypothetical protein